MTDQTTPPIQSTSSSSSYAPPLKRVEATLLSSWNDLHIRNEVDSCLQSMLLSVEATHHLEQQLLLENAKSRLEQTQAEYRATVLDAHAERLERYNRRIELADDLVVELVQTNTEMQKLIEWKEEHKYKVRNYDAVLAKLAQTEEELKAAHRVSYGGEAKPRAESPRKGTAADVEKNVKTEGDAAAVAAEPSTKLTETSLQPQASSSESAAPAPEQTPETDVEPVVTTLKQETTHENNATKTKVENPTTEGESAAETLKAAIAAEHEHDARPTPSPEEASAPAPNAADDEEPAEEDSKPPAVELIEVDVPEEKEPPKTEAKEEKKKEPKPGLLTLDVEPLMEIFGYLDPMDILNTAQINLTMYTKVDNIFGISEDGQAPPAPTPAPATAAPAAASQPERPATTTTTVPTKPPADAATKPAPPTHKKNNSSGSGPLGLGLLSMMQPAKPAPESTPSKPAAAARPQTGSASQPLNAKVAQSMAAKLTDAELAAIISMTDKLSKLEKEVHTLRSEKEVLAAKLEGTENVKQFLISKVRDVEIKLNRSKEDEVKVTQQIASDQEVIAFLDSRVQELEQQTVDLTKDNSITQAEFDSLKVSTSKKITMLNDMLKYEREKVREDESEWKATKKVLVKEVKSCRAQILTLQAERDGLKGQNDMLNRAINSSSNGSSNKRSPGRIRRKNTE